MTAYSHKSDQRHLSLALVLRAAVELYSTLFDPWLLGAEGFRRLDLADGAVDIPFKLDDLIIYKTLGLVSGLFCSPEAGDSSGIRDILMIIIYEWTSDHVVTFSSLTSESTMGFRPLAILG